MHMGDGCFSIGLVDVENVGCTTVRVELSIHRHIEVSDRAILPEDLAQVILIDGLCQLFNNNLCTASKRAFTSAPLVSVATQTPTLATESSITTGNGRW